MIERAPATEACTFAAAAELFQAAHESHWRNAKHRWQWWQALETHAFPSLGQRGVEQITAEDVLAILAPIWLRTPEVAARLRGALESILDYAKARGWRNGANPARWRGHLAERLPRQSKTRSMRHYACLPPAKLPRFIAALSREAGASALALRFTIVTGALGAETVGARWADLDIQKHIWHVKPATVNPGVARLVPLSAAALSILPRADVGGDRSAPLFPGLRDNKPLSDMAMTMLLRRMGHEELTVDGFRQSFWLWAADSLAGTPALASAAAALTANEAVSVAFEDCRQVMDAWGSFCVRQDA